MKFKREYFCCSPKLLRNIDEIHEVEAAITEVAWKDHFSIEAKAKRTKIRVVTTGRLLRN